MSDDLSNVLFATLLLIVAARLAWGCADNRTLSPSDRLRSRHERSALRRPARGRHAADACFGAGARTCDVP